MAIRCRVCKREIVWIQMASGKYSPCDPDTVKYRPAMSKNYERAAGNRVLQLITPEGKVVRGVIDPHSDKYGYISHYATCPYASYFRTPKKK